MILHFTEEELAGRRQKAIAAMEAEGLDGLLMFRQESMYYLTGYDTMGYSQFQCLYMGPDGDLVLLTRSADLRQSKFTSVIEDVRIWVDRGDANPGVDLRDILGREGAPGQTAGSRAGGLESDGTKVGNGKGGAGRLLRSRGRIAPGQRTSTGEEPRRDRLRTQGGRVGRRRPAGSPSPSQTAALPSWNCSLVCTRLCFGAAAIIRPAAGLSAPGRGP